MSSGELLLTLFVALLVFGPSKLPMVALHLGKILQQWEQFKRYVNRAWQSQLNELQLQENIKKALQADEIYQVSTMDSKDENSI